MLRSFAFVGHAQRDEIRVDAVLGQHRTYCAHSDRHRQYRYLVRFDNDCVASRKRGEQTGEGIPSGEGAATHDHRYTTADDLEMFFHDQRRVLALGFFPHRFAWHKTLLAPGMRHCLQTAVLSMRRACLEGHHPSLTGGEHHRVG